MTQANAPSTKIEHAWTIIRTIMAERDAYAADRDRLRSGMQALLGNGGEIPLLPAEGLAAAFARAFPHCNHEQRVALFEAMFGAFAEYIRANGVFARAAHDIGAAAGMHVAPLNYYSPIATRAEIEANAGHTLSAPLAAEKFDEAAQAARLHALLPHAAELHDVPMAPPEGGGFYWTNGMFGPQDAFTYYGLIREHRPARVLEVGSGFSTLMAARAAALNGTTQVTCIEPYPTDTHNSHLRAEAGFRLIETPVQQVALDLFTSLQPNDILFIDSSHVAKPGSDVEFLFFEVLPRIAPGVLVHVHDIFLPRGYTNHYYLEQNRHWNENYLLGALLLENPRWQVEIANAFVAGFGNNAALEAMVAALAGEDAAKRQALAGVAGGGSLWLRRLVG
jgi:predicted O-methyltransferase YrrM